MITVLGGTPSPFVRKIVIALEEKGIPYELEALSPFPKTPELLAISPLGKIPVLRDGDLHVPDSSVILAYLEKTHPSPPLYPEDPADYARALFLEELSDTRIVDVVAPILFEKLIKPMIFQQETDQARVDQLVADELPGLIEQLEGLMPAEGGPLLSRFSVADVAFGAQLMGLSFIDLEIDRAKAPKLRAYLDELVARPSFKAAVPQFG